MRIALVHIQMISAQPIVDAFATDWPEAEIVNFLDETLYVDRERNSAVGASQERFVALARHAAGASVDAILFTCSAFGREIEAAQRALPAIPVRKPNQAMIERAASLGARVGLLASFAPTLDTMPEEFPPGVLAGQALAAGAFEALNAGNGAAHDRIIADAALRELNDCDVLALAQASMARAASVVAEATGKVVLTTPQSAVRELRVLLGPESPARR